MISQSLRVGVLQLLWYKWQLRRGIVLGAGGGGERLLSDIQSLKCRRRRLRKHCMHSDGASEQLMCNSTCRAGRYRRQCDVCDHGSVVSWSVNRNLVRARLYLHCTMSDSKEEVAFVKRIRSCWVLCKSKRTTREIVCKEVMKSVGLGDEADERGQSNRTALFHRVNDGITNKL